MTSWELALAQAFGHSSFGNKVSSPWIEAFSDPRAELQTFSCCLSLGDLNSDGDCKLVVGDVGNGIQIKLKVFRGTFLSAELPLLTQPSAIACLYTDRNDPRVPGIAVATGPHVLVYRNCRPYFKFTLPSQECSSLETELWREVSSPEQLVNFLKDLSIELGFSNLSSPSQNLLLMDPSLRENYVSSNSHFSTKKQMVITCLATLSKYSSHEKDVSCALLATESAQLFVMDPETFTISNEFKLPNVCYNLKAIGVFMVEYTIIMAFRDGTIHTLKGNVVRYITQMTSHAVSLVLINSKIYTANMDSTLNCYSQKGRRYSSVKLPENPLDMIDIELTSFALHLLAVALSSGNIHLYNDCNLVHVITTHEPIYAMIFGRYGQEEHALISISSSGALDIRLLKRTAQFTQDQKSSAPVIRPQDIKFLVPKKNKLFLEQSLRERQTSKEMQTWFNYSLASLKVLISESYINALHNASVARNDSVKMIVEVVGLGPRMKIRTILQNMSQNVIPTDLKVTFLYDSRLYTINQPVTMLPAMVQGMLYIAETLVTCMTPVAGTIQILVISSTFVLLSTVINMPDCTQLLGYWRYELPNAHTFLITEYILVENSIGPFYDRNT